MVQDGVTQISRLPQLYESIHQSILLIAYPVKGQRG